MKILVRAPDHLGDGVMALPAIALLVEAGTVTVAAPGWRQELYGHLDTQLVDRSELSQHAAASDVVVLLKPSLSAAWQARAAPKRVGLPTDHRRLLLTDVVAPQAADEHRADALLRVAATALGQAAEQALPHFPAGALSARIQAALPSDFVLLLPGTASTETVAWRGMSPLCKALGPRAVVTGGPGDEAAIAATGGMPIAPTSLPELAALAVAASAVIGNDSGLPHLCAAAVRAAGQDVAKVHVVYASTTPARTGPPGSSAWYGPQPPCWPCYAKTCPIGAPCRDAPVAPLAEAL